MTRYRRTNLEIELEQKLSSAKSADDKSAYQERLDSIRRARCLELGLSFDAVFNGGKINPLEEKPEVYTGRARREVAMEVKASVIDGAITYQPITLQEPVIQEPSAIADDLAMEVSKRVLKSVTDLFFSELDTRTKSILSQVKAATQNRQVIAAIKINDGEIKKLKKAAHPELVKCLSWVKLGIKPLLVGPSGCGKTYLAEQVSEALGLEFGHLCFSAGVSETWLHGRQTPSGFIEGEFSKMYKNGGLFLADEIDAADPNLLLTLNTALANGHYYNPINGERITRNPNFVFIGGANTVGKGGDSVYTGRNRLDGASLDRFRIIRITYNPDVEQALCPDDSVRAALQKLRKDMEARGASELLSYRAFEDASAFIALGYSKEEILKIVTESWPQALREELGVKC